MSLMTDPDSMRNYSSRFKGHAADTDAESAKAFASSQNMSGGSWKGMAEAASFNTMTELNQAFRRIHEQMMFVSQGLARAADEYDRNEADAAAELRS
jgi:WXG100 family type VII secretion target